MKAPFIRLLVLGALALAGCPTAPVGTGAPAIDPVTCADLVGDFQATDFNVTGFGDPGLFNDFTAAGDALDFTFTDGAFTSTFTPADGDPLVTEGTFEAIDDDTIAFNSDPFIDGFAPGVREFECEFDEDAGVFTLVGDAPFDFDDDGAFEDATFEGTFERITEGF